MSAKSRLLDDEYNHNTNSPANEKFVASGMQFLQSWADGEVGGWGRDQKKFTGRDWGMGSSTI